METCVVCKKEVIWEHVIEEFEEILEQVNFYGEDSLTEHEQMVYHQEICSIECKELLP